MSCNYQQLPHAGIQTLTPYLPGKSIEELANESGISNIIKLASNENPLGCSPLVNEALAKLSDMQITNYPDPANHPLLTKLSQKLGISEQMLTVGNGSDLLFFFLLTAFALHTDKSMVTHEHAFISYHIQAQTLGIPIIVTPLKSDWQVDIEAMINVCNRKPAIIFLANPNNPTGVLIPHPHIKQLLANVPSSTILVLDEAYYEYAFSPDDETSINLLAQHPNLIITRTFSKAYGLAGLRLGYAIAHPELTEILQRVQLPFAVNQAALAAAYAALDDESFIIRSVALNSQGMQQMMRGLKELKLNYIPSSCNFITIDCQTNALPIYQTLLKEGIIVRPLLPYGLMQYLRVSIGTTEQNSRFINKLAACFQK
ncbi:histidinol-phosphate transaminase [Legionella fairfieldensis]|uniref:histidinol-phosphate transaminase n=1 Tax=Legionella fairfieldensis TaxID=45064 RepID=UPI00048E1514|nr:histidinol-phosphate transaminase [Legionella fairfieldensis]